MLLDVLAIVLSVLAGFRCWYWYLFVLVLFARVDRLVCQLCYRVRLLRSVFPKRLLAIPVRVLSRSYVDGFYAETIQAHDDFCCYFGLYLGTRLYHRPLFL